MWFGGERYALVTLPPEKGLDTHFMGRSVRTSEENLASTFFSIIGPFSP
jgi:hypothetical protein